jgi:thiol-disulfide isomerase/thioredoxin
VIVDVQQPCRLVGALQIFADLIEIPALIAIVGALDDPEVRREREELKNSLAPWKVILSVDRLDYSKGILNRLEGYEIFLDSNPEYRGKVVLVNFWATWCVPCRDEMPSIERLRASLDGRRFAVLAVNLAEPESRIQKFLESVPLNFPVLLDRDAKIARAWQAKLLPATYIVGPDGTIRYRHLGELDWSKPEVRALVVSLMK